MLPPAPGVTVPGGFGFGVKVARSGGIGFLSTGGKFESLGFGSAGSTAGRHLSPDGSV